MAEKIGRNDPCPCGSGKKYKYCCLGKNTGVKEALPPREEPLNDLERELARQNFRNEAEETAFVERYLERQAALPQEEFHGLTPVQMRSFVEAPYDSPELVSFPENVELGMEPIPLLALVALLVPAIGEDGMRTTGKGSLPLEFCRKVARFFFGEEEYDRRIHEGRLNCEEDFELFHVARVVSEQAGFIKKVGKTFFVVPKWWKVWNESEMAGLYPHLLRTYSVEFNWAYADLYEDCDFIQETFLFTLYLLSLFGDEWRSSEFYEDKFLLAFPTAVDEMEKDKNVTPEVKIRAFYSQRSFGYYTRLLGLAEVEDVCDEDGLAESYSVKKTPLLDRAVQFHV